METGIARAKAYVGYAQAHPGMYGLMFRTERLDMKRPSLEQAANASFAELVGAVGASRHEHISEQALSLDQAAAIARAWSLVHGFTMLLLDGRLSDILSDCPKGRTSKPCWTPCCDHLSLGRGPTQSGEGSGERRETPDIFAGIVLELRLRDPCLTSVSVPIDHACHSVE